MIKIPMLLMVNTVLTFTVVNAAASEITIIRPNLINSSSHIIEVNPGDHISKPVPYDGSYYIGNYKKIDGTIQKDCYARILHSSSGRVIGTEIVCPNAEK